MFAPPAHVQQGHNHNLYHRPSKDPIVVVGIPSVSVHNNALVVGDASTSSTRSYTPLKVLGDGSFGTVWLCDWHGILPPNTPLSPMQCGAGARPEWAGKRLVAVKRMKKRWEGWDECKKLKELESLRAIPFHPNIIPLYDFFLLPTSNELYFVFESMEGNLYNLIKARKGRPLAGGLVSSIFGQIVAGLYHIHASGYFHRDMKPENVLVTTTGLFDYQSLSPIALPNALPEKDVVTIIKLADFGLARETKSKPPYTEYVSTRWYRAPEVLLMSRDYSNPVDMWALGTIMAELVNLRPLFPGSGQMDQVARICAILGDPSDKHGFDVRGKPIGGGKWSRGIDLARDMGFAFPRSKPHNIISLFDRSVPIKLVECIADLLKYDPEIRLTSLQCLEHPYLLETSRRNNIPFPSGHPALTHHIKRAQPNGASTSVSLPLASPRNVHHQQIIPPPPKSHPSPHVQIHVLPDVSVSHRTPFFPPVPAISSSSPTASSSQRTTDYINDLHFYEQARASSDLIQVEQRSDAAWGHDQNDSSPSGPSTWDMDVSPSVEVEIAGYDIDGQGQPMDIPTSPMVQEYPARPPVEPEHPHAIVNGLDSAPHQHVNSNKLKRIVDFGKPKWSKMFGRSDALPPVDEVPVAGSSSSTPSLKRTSSSADSRSLSELSPVVDAPTRAIKDLKQMKKEAVRVQREADKQKRALAEKMHREQARAVMEKRSQVLMSATATEQLEWKWQNSGLLAARRSEQDIKGKQAASGPIRQGMGTTMGSPTISAAAGRFGNEASTSMGDWRRDNERYPKARRRDLDDDHSMSSSDVHSVGPLSNISFATVDSDPGPARVRQRPSLFGINRMQSTSSLRTSFDNFVGSGRSSNSLSHEQQLANEFDRRANMDPGLSGSVSPPPMQTLSLSTSSSPWMHHNGGRDNGSMVSGLHGHTPYMSLPVPQHPSNMDPMGPNSPYDYGSSSPGIPKSAINPIFKVPPLPVSTDRLSSSASLPPFSQLEAVAEGEYPPLSPMSFHTPDDA